LGEVEQILGFQIWEGLSDMNRDGGINSLPLWTTLLSWR
jgi:hypothetical protein